jgi:hypothetical protein
MTVNSDLLPPQRTENYRSALIRPASQSAVHYLALINAALVEVGLGQDNLGRRPIPTQTR